MTNTVYVLATHDENYGLAVTLHKTEADAWETLRFNFLDGELDDDATPEVIAAAANEMSVLTWSITVEEVPA